MAISALSPKRLPNLMIRVYPPGRSPTFGATSRNNIETASLFLRYLKVVLRLCVVSSFDFVTNGSINCFKAFALVTVVLILLCSINEHAILASIDLRWAVFLPKCITFFPCLILLYIKMSVSLYLICTSQGSYRR